MSDSGQLVGHAHEQFTRKIRHEFEFHI